MSVPRGGVGAVREQPTEEEQFHPGSEVGQRRGSVLLQVQGDLDGEDDGVLLLTGSSGLLVCVLPGLDLGEVVGSPAFAGVPECVAGLVCQGGGPFAVASPVLGCIP